MAVATYSPEGRMIARLRNLGCSELAFGKIVNGIIGKNRIAEAFKDPTRSFDNDIAQRLLERVQQMEELAQAVHPVPVNWSDADRVADALTTRLAAQTAKQLNLTNDLDQVAQWATMAVVGTAGESSTVEG